MIPGMIPEMLVIRPASAGSALYRFVAFLTRFSHPKADSGCKKAFIRLNRRHARDDETEAYRQKWDYRPG